MIGASFQPGVDDRERRQQGPQGGPRPSPSGGVQEAIKVLSLRLPKVVGAQAVSPHALLSSQGSRGNPNVDSIVQSVLQQMFPNPAAPGGRSQQVESQVNMISDLYHTPSQAPEQVIDYVRPDRQMPTTPNIIVGTPPQMPYGNPKSGTDADLSGGGTGQPPALIAPLPTAPPDLRRNFDWLPTPQEPMPLI